VPEIQDHVSLQGGFKMPIKVKVVQLLGGVSRGKKNPQAGMVKALCQYSCGGMAVHLLYCNEFEGAQKITPGQSVDIQPGELAFV
jgi:hypothetical protein